MLWIHWIKDWLRHMNICTPLAMKHRARCEHMGGKQDPARAQRFQSIDIVVGENLDVTCVMGEGSPFVRRKCSTSTSPRPPDIRLGLVNLFSGEGRILGLGRRLLYSVRID